MLSSGRTIDETKANAVIAVIQQGFITKAKNLA